MKSSFRPEQSDEPESSLFPSLVHIVAAFCLARVQARKVSEANKPEGIEHRPQITHCFIRAAGFYSFMQAGINVSGYWIPAFAGMTKEKLIKGSPCLVW